MVANLQKLEETYGGGNMLEAILPHLYIISVGIATYLILSGIAKIVKNVTLARKIEQNIINQIEDMVKAKMEKQAKAHE